MEVSYDILFFKNPWLKKSGIKIKDSATNSKASKPIWFS
jgi:hypothetical protein